MKNQKPIFVIQKHDATNLHYDLRLEMSDVLKSWAVPKEPPKSIEIKRLAIQVTDHDLDYANFEGEIKEGYGAGSVEIWDKGTYELESKSDKKIVFKLHGKKLKGKYILLKTNYGKDKKQKQKNWLLFKTSG